MKILAVDDDAVARDILHTSLVYAGYNEIDLAQSAAEAVKLIQSADVPYECMLLDIIMPNTGGIELCKIVRQMPEYFGIPIIMITAVENQDTLMEAIRVGATDYVHKPFDGIELVTRLRVASILDEAIKNASLYATDIYSTGQQREAADLKLSDAFSLDERCGAVSQVNLWYELTERDPLPKSVQLFAVSIAGTATIFRDVSNASFRAFINDAAQAIGHITSQWSPRISYIGHGTFIIALLEAEAFTIEKAQLAFKTSLKEIPCTSLSIYKGRIRFCFEHVVPDATVEQTSANALCALLQAGADARKIASDCRSLDQQRELRLRFLGRGVEKPITSWETTWAKSARRVQPKRIVARPDGRNSKPDSRGNQSDASFEKNIFFRAHQL